MTVCIGSVKFNMKADILRQSGGSTPPTTDGHWEDQQDPITGEIIRVWVPLGVDDPDTPEDESVAGTFKCMARGIVGNGLRGQGTTETWGGLYSDTDFVRIEFPKKVILSQRDRVTNIRDGKNKIIWMEEAYPQGDSGGPTTFLPTVFKVLGVTPVVDPFGHHYSNAAMLERASVQQNG